MVIFVYAPPDIPNETIGHAAHLTPLRDRRAPAFATATHRCLPPFPRGRDANHTNANEKCERTESVEDDAFSDGEIAN